MNENHLSPDDPLLTAYALDELDGPERATVEAVLAANPALRAVVDDIRATATRLETALATEPMPVASAVVMPHAPRARVVRFPVAYYIIGSLAAACFAILIGRYEPSSRVVRQENPRTEESKNYVVLPLAPAVETDVKSEGQLVVKTPAIAKEEGKSPANVEPSPYAVIQVAPEEKQNEPVKNVTAAPLLSTPMLGAAPELYGPGVPPGSVTPLLESPSTRTLPATGQVARPAPAAATLAKYDQNRNGRLDAGEVATMQADQRKPLLAQAQTAGDKTVELSPFEVVSDTKGYYASSTMSGTRFNSKIEDMGSSVTVVTKEQMSDFTKLGINDISLYSASTEGTGTYVNSANRNGNYSWGTNGSAPPRQPALNTESYGQRQDNEFIAVASEPLSTFSIDVDTAGYSNVRRFLQNGQLPPRDAVRVEELVNYFPYRYAAPTNNTPFAATLEVASTPWEPKHRLVRIGLKGREISQAARPAANLVFLLDVSGSMNAPNRLPLVKESLHLLVGKLRADDHVAIVTYAGKTGLELPSTPVARASEILAAIDGLQSSGSTNGEMGIQLAYDIAKANFVSGGVNRVILCTDGDFNVGISDQGDLVRLIEEKAKSNVFLTVLGFGYGNLKDSTLELLADKGNGNYGYIDSRREAEKLLVEQVSGTLVTIAKDVKIQVEFNPAQVSAYRLLGYENRLLKKEDFNNDKVDAGEIGAGHTVTALYELIPANADEPMPVVSVDALKYQRTEGQQGTSAKGAPQTAARNPQSQELLTVKIRYKEPTGDESKKLEFPLTDHGAEFAAMSGDFKFAAAVASFGLALRTEPIKGGLLADAARWAEDGLGDDPNGYRAEFAGLVRQAQALVTVRGAIQ